ncbi:Glutamine ABC transporter, periplasmic glutamine-binding protein [hydrothermal vent metagenome]|uniref:Glutamine ABC transporter, periplasmic glutamine-binding protein n=1 Tax=hydrothermal vent metagenome TaxID=652676 RepID=A0A1W1EKY9_9ZZZZ
MRFIISIILFFTFIHSETLKVGIKASEPWVMYDKNIKVEERKPIGFSIDLWNKIAKELNIKTQWIYYNSTSDLIKSVKSGDVNLSISAITITSNREKEIDFSSSMYELGLQVMVDATKSSASVLELMAKEINKMITLKSILIFFIFLLITIHLRWFIDKRNINSKLFSKKYFPGIIDSFWWGITMLVTWETPPNKGLARVIDLMWHIVGIIAISILTAIVTSALTAQAIGGSIRSEKDLAGKYIAVIANDAPRKYVEKIGANIIPVDTLQEAIKLVRLGKADALVHDGPRLVYLANKINKKEHKQVLLVSRFKFNPQNYGIAFPSNSPLKELVDRELLKLRESNGLEKSFHKQLQEKWLKVN